MTNFESLTCSDCLGGFGQDEQIVNATGETYHTYCFV
jgi:hypothetical protein